MSVKWGTCHDRRVMSPSIPTSLIRIAKPLLRVHLGLYRREVASAPYPLDEPMNEVAGSDPDHLAFIGSIAVSGFGVLHHGMKASSQVGQRVAAARGHGCSWTEVTSPTLTARTTLREKTLVQSGTEAAVLFLGITDVLLGTTTDDWHRDLLLVVDRIRAESGRATTVVVAGIPPMTKFRAIPPVAARLIDRQIEALNGTSHRLALETEGVSFVPFPAWDVGELFIQDALSWSQMHKLWAKALAPVVVAALDAPRATPAPRTAAQASHLGEMPTPLGAV
jgi:hypothetical protein